MKKCDVVHYMLYSNDEQLTTHIKGTKRVIKTSLSYGNQGTNLKLWQIRIIAYDMYCSNLPRGGCEGVASSYHKVCCNVNIN